MILLTTCKHERDCFDAEGEQFRALPTLNVRAGLESPMESDTAHVDFEPYDPARLLSFIPDLGVGPSR